MLWSSLKQADAFRLALLVQPSSAAAKRIFSIVQCFETQQELSLKDYPELFVIKQLYNLAFFLIILHLHFNLKKRIFDKQNG